MSDKTNIYGDYRICCKCEMKADVVENGNDLCASCYFKHHTNTTLEEYEKRVKQLDQARNDKNKTRTK